MLVAEMAVHFHCQRAAVFMAEPSETVEIVNAVLKAARGVDSVAAGGEQRIFSISCGMAVKRKQGYFGITAPIS